MMTNWLMCDRTALSEKSLRYEFFPETEQHFSKRSGSFKFSTGRSRKVMMMKQLLVDSQDDDKSIDAQQNCIEWKNPRDTISFRKPKLSKLHFSQRSGPFIRSSNRSTTAVMTKPLVIDSQDDDQSIDVQQNTTESKTTEIGIFFRHWNEPNAKFCSHFVFFTFINFFLSILVSSSLNLFQRVVGGGGE